MNSRKGIDIVMFVMGILMLVCSFFEYNNKGFNLNIVLTVCSIVIISISLGRLLGRNIDTSRGETILRKDVVFVTAGEENSYNEEDKIELDPMLVIRKTLLFAFAGVIFLFVVVRQFQFDEKALTEIEINEKTYYEKNDGDVCITDELDTVYLLDSRFASSQVKDFLETHQNKRVILSVNDKNKIFSIQDAETMILDSDKVKRVYRFNMIFFFTLGVIMCVAAGCLILYNSNGIRIYMPGKIRK